MIIRKIPWTSKPPQGTRLSNRAGVTRPARALLFNNSLIDSVTGAAPTTIDRSGGMYVNGSGLHFPTNIGTDGLRLANLSLSSEMTIIVWARAAFATSTSYDQYLFNTDTSVSTYLRYSQGADDYAFRVLGSSGSAATATDNTAYNNEIKCFAGTYSSSDLVRLYINGVQRASSAAVGNISSYTSISIGNSYTGVNSASWYGDIFEVYIFNKKLSAAEIAEAYRDRYRWWEPRTQYIPTYTAPATTNGLITRKIPWTSKPNLPATPKESGKYPPVHAGWLFEAGGLKNFGKANLNTAYQATPGAITTSKYGRCVEFTSVTQGVNLDADQTKVFPTAPTLTVLIHSIKTDTTLRANCAFAANTGGDDTKQCKVHLAYTNGTTYFDFGGTSVGGGSRVTLASSNYTDSVWAFTVGIRGMEIWQDGVRKSLNAVAPVTRNASSSLAAVIGNNDIVDGDLVKVPALFIWHQQLSMAELAALTRSKTAYLDIFAPRTQRIPISASTAYSLSAGLGTYTYTGQNPAFTFNKTLSLDAGSYTYTGQNPTGVFGRNLTPDAGSYTYTGQDPTPSYGRIATLDAGNYTYTGQDPTPAYGRSATLDAGSYTYTGQDPTGVFGRVLTPDVGTYTYSGFSAILTFSGAPTPRTLLPFIDPRIIKKRLI